MFWKTFGERVKDIFHKTSNVSEKKTNKHLEFDKNLTNL